MPIAIAHRFLTPHHPRRQSTAMRGQPLAFAYIRPSPPTADRREAKTGCSSSSTAAGTCLVVAAEEQVGCMQTHSRISCLSAPSSSVALPRHPEPLEEGDADGAKVGGLLSCPPIARPAIPEATLLRPKPGRRPPALCRLPRLPACLPPGRLGANAGQDAILSSGHVMFAKGQRDGPDGPWVGCSPGCGLLRPLSMRCSPGCSTA